MSSRVAPSDVARNLSGLREEGDVSERKGNGQSLLQRDEVRTQGEGTEDGTSPKDGCPDLKKNPILFNYTGFPKMEPGPS